MADCAPLADRIGDDIVTASGTTLLGADNKAGVAEIVTRRRVPGAASGDSAWPDQDCVHARRGGRARNAALRRRGLRRGVRYTMDGSTRGELGVRELLGRRDDASTFVGFNTHPGYAKDRLVNSIKVAADFIRQLPRDMSPEATEGYDGFVHPYVLQGGGGRRPSASSSATSRPRR